MVSLNLAPPGAFLRENKKSEYDSKTPNFNRRVDEIYAQQRSSFAPRPSSPSYRLQDHLVSPQTNNYSTSKNSSELMIHPRYHASALSLYERN